MQSNKDMNIENGRDIQKALNNESSNKELLQALDNRMVNIEMKMGVDVQS